MVFSSTFFLLAFLPIVFILHTLINNIHMKNAILLIASLLFYSVGEPIYVILMVFSICMNYIFGLIVCKKNKKTVLIAAIIANVAILAVFKYTDFLIETVNSFSGMSIPLTGIKLPIGISFFTFQALSYVIDVYREPELSQRNIFKLALYISFFPQLIAGPIVKYSDIAGYLNHRRFSVSDVADGLRRFIFGLSKKVIIANTVGRAADVIFGMNGGGWLPAWFGAVAYCLQIYYDFSGYSDMAIGLGRMFGFHFHENFNHPYRAVTLRDFWHRWHISLSSWFKKYVYIPLGGNKKGEQRTEINRLIVFFLTGLWHGAGINFIVWGLIHGVCSVLEDVFTKDIKVPKSLSRIYTLFVVLFAFIFFRAETMAQAGAYIASLFTAFSVGSIRIFLSLLTPKMIIAMAAGLYFCFFPKKKKHSSHKKRERLSYTAAAVLFAFCVMELASAGYNPFIYFRF